MAYAPKVRYTLQDVLVFVNLSAIQQAVNNLRNRLAAFLSSIATKVSAPQIAQNAPESTEKEKAVAPVEVKQVKSRAMVAHVRSVRMKGKRRVDYKAAKNVLPGEEYWYKVEGKWLAMAA